MWRSVSVSEDGYNAYGPEGYFILHWQKREWSQQADQRQDGNIKCTNNIGMARGINFSHLFKTQAVFCLVIKTHIFAFVCYPQIRTHQTVGDETSVIALQVASQQFSVVFFILAIG